MNRRNSYRTFKLGQIIILWTALLALGGCATAVSEKNMDPDFKSDGLWKAEIQPTRGIQHHAGWEMQCNDMSGEFSFLVKNSQVEMEYKKELYTTFVDKKGYFRLVLPTEYKSGSSIESEVSMANSDVSLIIEGHLLSKNQEGKLIVGVRSFGNNGCMSEIAYTKIRKGKLSTV